MKAGIIEMRKEGKAGRKLQIISDWAKAKYHIICLYREDHPISVMCSFFFKLNISYMDLFSVLSAQSGAV